MLRFILTHRFSVSDLVKSLAQTCAVIEESLVRGLAMACLKCIRKGTSRQEPGPSERE
jgi:hypothetical protein